MSEQDVLWGTRKDKARSEESPYQGHMNCKTEAGKASDLGAAGVQAWQSLLGTVCGDSAPEKSAVYQQLA